VGREESKEKYSIVIEKEKTNWIELMTEMLVCI
jgi:hypothetical protein